MSGFKLRRLGMIMEPEQGNPQEIEGVLNPAAVRGPHETKRVIQMGIACLSDHGQEVVTL